MRRPITISFLTFAGAVGCAALFGSPASAQDVIRIGAPLPITGALSP
jgi:hypothetical protein